MRIDGVAFEAPAGLEDSTSYSWQASDTHEELSLELELPVGGATPAEQVIGEVREGLAGYFDGAYRTIAEGDAALAGVDGKFVHYALTGSESVVSKIIVANAGPTAEGRACGDWIKLAWSSEAPSADVDAALGPVVASLVPVADVQAGVAGVAAVAPGCVRHQAGPWSLDVPAHLHGPRTFIFEDIVAELRVELSVLEADEGEPGLDGGIASAGAEELARQETELDGGARIDLRLRSDDDPNGESTVILAKRELELGGALAGQTRWVVVSATGPTREGARLTAIVDALLASIRADDGSGGGGQGGS